jgi:hypothetical protein
MPTAQLQAAGGFLVLRTTAAAAVQSAEGDSLTMVIDELVLEIEVCHHGRSLEF